MHNIGTIDSIATIIFMAGDKRFAVPHSTFHYHGAKVTFGQGANFVLAQAKEFLDGFEKMHQKMAGIICDNTEMTKADVEELFLHGRTKELAFAKTKGIIDEVSVPNIENGSPLIHVNNA